jgi:peptidoglycan/LPS O-acetylase OafA/YrhL
MATSRMAHLDSLRGIAALCVAYSHCAWAARSTAAETSILEDAAIYVATEAIDLGKLGVVSFFMLSGYLVPSMLKGGTGQFLLTRAARILPMYWVSALVALVVLQPTLSAADLLGNVLPLQGFVGATPIQGLYWTIQIELCFYAMCAALHWKGLILRKGTVLTLAMLFLAIAAALAAYRATGVETPVALPLSLTMMLLGHLIRTDRKAALTLLVAVVIALPAITAMAYGENAPRYVLTYFVAAGAFFAVVTQPRLLSDKMAGLGRVSYSFYLLAGVTQGAIQNAGIEPLPFLGTVHGMFVAVVAITYPLALACHRFVEMPVIAWAKRRYETMPVWSISKAEVPAAKLTAPAAAD